MEFNPPTSDGKYKCSKKYERIEKHSSYNNIVLTIWSRRRVSYRAIKIAQRNNSITSVLSKTRISVPRGSVRTTCGIRVCPTECGGLARRTIVLIDDSS